MKVLLVIINTIFELVILSPLSMLYGLVVAIRNLLFDLGLSKQKKIPRPVISVGNISVGGSGKTPVVLEILSHFKDKRIAVLSRGYGSEIAKKRLYPEPVMNGSQPTRYGDEPSMIIAQFPEQNVILDSNRFRGGEWALEHYPEIDFFVLDDGFQHRKLYRDINILVFDVNKFLKKPGLLPLGRLREPLSALKRADYIFLSKWQHLSQNKVNSIKSKIKLFTKAKISLIHAHIASVHNQLGEELPSTYDGKLLVVSALGSPDTLLKDIKKHFVKAQEILTKEYADHYSFVQEDVDKCVEEAQKIGAKLVCTEKDFIKIKNLNSSERFYVAKQFVDIPEDVLSLIAEDLKGKTGE